MATCRGCGAEILWALTESGRRMPLDAEPNPAGAYTLIPPSPRARPVAALTAVRVAGEHHADEPRYMQHWATCPERDRFRRRRR